MATGRPTARRTDGPSWRDSSFDPTRWPAGVEQWLAAGDREPIQIVDSHTQGNPTRVVLGGVTPPAGVRGVPAVREWLRQDADWLRRRLVHEPRGGGLTCAVLPVADANPDPVHGWDIGAVILEPGSYPPMCGHCIIGFATVIVELQMLPGLRADDAGAFHIRIRTPAGVVRVTVAPAEAGGFRVDLTNVVSYPVLATTVDVDGTAVPVDLLWGGDYYISVDTDRLGLVPNRDGERQLVHLAQRLRHSFQRGTTLDPVTGHVLDVYQVMFYRRDPDAEASWQTLVVAPPRQVDRSPCGTGTSALIAHLMKAGAVPMNGTVTTRSIVGGEFTATAAPATTTPARAGAVVPVISGSAYINGFHIVAADPADPFRDGFESL